MSEPIIERLPVVRIVDDGRRAIMELPFEAAPELGTEAALMSLARERGVIVDRAVNEAIRLLAARHTSRAAGDVGVVEAVIASAQSAVDGSDARVDWMPEFQACARAACESDDSGAQENPDSATPVDHYNRIKRVKIIAGTVLGVLVPPDGGCDGQDVCGRSIAARRGRKLALQPDGSVQVEADGSIRALKDGVFSLARLKIAVLDELEVKGCVDYSTGNIDFVGTVKVSDGVRDNFTVRATGDVLVRGLVESADLIVGGDCVCERGVAGRSKGHLIVDGSLTAAHVNGVRGRIRADLNIDREIVGCDFVVGGDVRVTRGSIVGGSLVVGGKLKAVSIGTEGGVTTTIRAGLRPIELGQAARLAALITTLAKESAPLIEREEEIGLLGDRASAADKERVTELAYEIAEVQRRLQLLAQHRARLLLEAGKQRVLRIEVDRVIYAGTVLAVGNQIARFNDSVKGPLLISWDENRKLQLRVGTGRVQDLSEVASVREVAA